VRLKIEAGLLFWDLDYVGIDYGEDVPLSSVLLTAETAADEQGTSVRQALIKEDDSYLDQTEIGDCAFLSFRLPVPRQGSRRSLFLHSRGYYDLKRQPSGEPDIPMLLSFREPGAFPGLSRRLFASLLDEKRKVAP
jgi:hypothetical protein